jgi:4-amino-4-deoxy-L-arabinose transferase-like glycosyltransferase
MHTPSQGKYTGYLLWGPALIAFILYFWSAWQSDFSRREAREAIPVANMFQGESIWLPKIHDNQYRTKPPLFYWAGLLSSKVLGEVSEISVRLPSVLAGTGAVFLTTLLGFWIFSPITGFMAGLITATSLQFTYLSILGRIDMLFVFFITLAMTASWKMIHDEEARTRNLFSWLTAWGLGFAFLTKGPLGLIFPLIALYLYTRIQHRPIPWKKLFLLPLAITSLWFIEGSVKGGEEFTSMIYRESIGRITGDSSIAFHNEPFYSYFFMIAYGFLPWSLFLPVVLWQAIPNHLKDPRWLYLAVAFATLFILLSVVPGKRDAYLVPVYPMASLLIAHGISRSIDKDNDLYKEWAWTWRVIMVLLAGLGFFVALVAFNPEILSFITNLDFVHPNDRWMAERLIENHFPSKIFFVTAMGCLLFSAGMIYRGVKNNSVKTCWVSILVVTLLTLLWVRGPVTRAENLYSSFKPFGEQAHLIVGENPITSSGEILEDLSFYLNLQFDNKSPGEAAQILRKNPDTYLLIPEIDSKGILQTNPEFKVLLESTEGIKRKYLLIKNFTSHAKK